MSETLVALDGVWQEFRPRTEHGSRRRRTDPLWALKDVTFGVRRGEVVALIGHNGSGKTTLLRTLAGVLEPSRGTCRIGGRVGSLLDLTAGLNRDLSGNENIMLGAVLLGMSRSQVRAEYDAITAFSGLAPDVLSQPLSAYSAGMTLRVAFSVLTRTGAPILLVDEVLAVGDEEFQLRALDWIRDHGRDAAVVMASHDLELVRSFCDRALVFDGGVLRFDGPPEEALDAYAELRQMGAEGIGSEGAGRPSRSRGARGWVRPFGAARTRRARQ